MTRLERQAFDFADDNCPWCKGDENPEGFCDASALMKGYLAGFRAARDELANSFRGWVVQHHCEAGLVTGPKTLISGAPVPLSDTISAIGEEPDEEHYNERSEGSGGDGSLA